MAKKTRNKKGGGGQPNRAVVARRDQDVEYVDVHGLVDVDEKVVQRTH